MAGDPTGESARGALWPSAGVALAGAVWGVFWIPTRYFEVQGLSGGLASVAMFAVTSMVLLPVMFRCRRGPLPWRALAFSGGLTGLAFAFYTNALLLTDVVRVLLLFYLTPFWGAILGRLLLGETLTRQRVAALGLALAGLLVVLGLGAGWPLPQNAGDWMALASGLLWAYGCVRITQAPEIGTLAQSFAFCAGATLFSCLIVAVIAADAADLPPLSVNWRLLGALLAFAVLMNAPCIIAAVWGAQSLSPARVGILLTGEIVCGVASAALLLDEAFGAREVLGSLLIILAAIVEVMPARWLRN